MLSIFKITLIDDSVIYAAYTSINEVETNHDAKDIVFIGSTTVLSRGVFAYGVVR